MASLAAVTGAPAVNASANTPPASGHAEVVAQGIVSFGDGPWHWQLASGSVGRDAAALDTAHPGFVVAGGPGAVVVGSADGPIARLAAGEGLFLPRGEPATVAALDEDQSATVGVTLVEGAGPDEFSPGPGLRDVDLVRDVLPTNEAFVIHADVSVFVAVTQGAVNVGSEVVTVGAGVALSGDVTLVNVATEPAIVVAAVVGPSLGSAPPPGGTTTAGLPATDPPAPETPSAGTTPTVTASTVAATTASTTITSATTTPSPTTPSTTITPGPSPLTTVVGPVNTFVPNPDQDGDGLSDDDEDANGCSSLRAHTDTDGLTDYREVYVYGTNCNDNDSDDDNSADHVEVKYGYDPTDPNDHP